jgi:3-hydroxy-5-methyl-1-naphthoate 3-O-methyltransferase
MILNDLQAKPATDPSNLIRLRDSIYAADLLITAIGHYNFFTWLNANPSNIETIIKNLNLASRPTDVMLTYFTALGLIEKKENIFYTTEYANEHLIDNAEWNLIPYFSTQTERPVVKKMLNVLKTGQPASWSGKENEIDWEKAMLRDDFADMFTAGMDSRGAYFAPGLAGSFDFSKYNSIIDIAGASGIYAACIKSQYPDIEAALYEKPPVDKIASLGLEKRGIREDIRVYGGDMFKDDLPKGFDIHLYSHAFHDWDINLNKKLVRKSFHCLNSGGLLMIHDAHINRNKTGPLSVAEYSVLLMFSTTGKCYSIAELEELLLSEGFKNIKYTPTIGNRSIITGQKV